MRYLILVEICDTLHNLLEHKLCILLTQLPSLPDIVEKIATGTQFHYDHVMFVRLECLQNLDIVRMSKTLQDIDLIHNLLLLALFFHEVHVDALDGAQFPRQPVQSKVDLSKCTFS